MNNHDSKLRILCRICGENVGKDASTVEKQKDLISHVFFVELRDEDPVVYPKKICYKCLSAMRNSKKRCKAPSISILTWEKCSEKCRVCHKSTKFASKTDTLSPQDNTPPPSQEECWSRATILQGLQWSDDISIPEEIDEEVNPHLPYLICWQCKGIVIKPIQILACQHVFCRGFLVPYLEG